MRKNILVFLVVFLIMFPFRSAHPDIIPINLNDFYADPSVNIAPSGNSATMYEDQSLITVLLSNDPALGDPGISVPSGLLTLNFNYSFTEGAENDDNFFVKVFDGTSGTELNSFLIDSSGSGPITWDLSSLDPSITLLGLEFQLNANVGDTGFDSVVALSNVQLETAAAPVPEPSTMILLGSGLVGLIGLGRKRLLKAS